MNDLQLQRYARSLLLEPFGFNAQARLLRSRALIVGLGGLGSPVAMYLAAAGVGTLVLADPDTVSLSNLQRQIIHDTASIGQLKVASAQMRLQALNPDCRIITLSEPLTPDSVAHWIGRVDIVLDCTDNQASRQALNRLCFQQQTPLVAAAAAQWQGWVSSFHTAPGLGCYACLYDPQDDIQDTPCATMGVLPPLLGWVGSAQAIEALHWLGRGQAPLAQHLLQFDALTQQTHRLGRSPNPHCPVCGHYQGLSDKGSMR